MRNNEWIPIKSGNMPEDNVIVQVTYIGIDDKLYCDMLAFIDNGVWHSYEGVDVDDEESLLPYGIPVKVAVTAWMPLPEPYKKEDV